MIIKPYNQGYIARKGDIVAYGDTFKEAFMLLAGQLWVKPC